MTRKYNVDNIILIMCDTLRRDFLGCYGNEWISTPNIDMFAKDSVIFNRSYAASFPTIPNRHDIFTGKYTFTFSSWEPLPIREIILPEVLRQARYKTMLITDTANMLKDGFHYDRGFDGWLWIRGQEYDRYMTNPKVIKNQVSNDKLREKGIKFSQYMRNRNNWVFEKDYFCAQVMTQSCEWLERNYLEGNFFLWIDSFDPHEPWDPPKWYTDMYDPNYTGEEIKYPSYGPSNFLSDSELKHIRSLYAGEITFVDRWLGRLFEKIQDLGLLENTAIIFTSDHGNYLGDHGFIGKTCFRPEASGWLPMYEEIAHTPLIIRLPDNTGLSHNNKLVQPPDLTATVLDLAGVNYSKDIQGKSLCPLMEESDLTIRDITLTSPPFGGMEHLPLRLGQSITLTSEKWAFILPLKLEKILKDFTHVKYIVKSFEKLLNKKIEPELYDLKNDPKQSKNLICKRKDVSDELYSNLLNIFSKWKIRYDLLEYFEN